jgi:pimeloyl-ACP methyl ester carboxylesterase
VGTPIRGRTIGTLAIVATALLGACGGEGDQPATGSREVTFESSDGVALDGRLFGPDDAPAGIVLAHMAPSDQSSWFDFAERLGREGYRVLTFNFRGYCPGGEAGCSEGERSIPAIWQDVEGAIGELRERGVRRVGLVGASMGGTASLVAASKEGTDVDAIVTLSAPTEFEGLDANGEVVAQVPGAKLFIAGHEDAAAAAAVDILYAQSLQPKRPVILTTGDHGTDILTGNQAGIAATEIIGWLERYVAVDG